jgi:hypothetical protein
MIQRPCLLATMPHAVPPAASIVFVADGVGTTRATADTGGPSDVVRHHVPDSARCQNAAAGVATGVPGDYLTVRAFRVTSVVKTGTAPAGAWRSAPALIRRPG